MCYTITLKEQAGKRKHFFTFTLALVNKFWMRWVWRSGYYIFVLGDHNIDQMRGSSTCTSVLLFLRATWPQGTQRVIQQNVKLTLNNCVIVMMYSFLWNKINSMGLTLKQVIQEHFNP